MISCRVSGRRLSAAVLAAGLAFSAACSDDKPDEGGTSLPRATTTSTTSAAERYAIPETITPEYVNDVLAALNHVYGDVFRSYLTSKQLSPADVVPLRAIYSQAEFEEQAAALAKTPLGSPDDYPSPVGDRRITVTRILSTSPTCVSAEGTYDFSAVLKSPPALRSVWLSLRAKDTASDVNTLNPTPWSIATENLTAEDKCAS